MCISDERGSGRVWRKILSSTHQYSSKSKITISARQIIQQYLATDLERLAGNLGDSVLLARSLQMWVETPLSVASVWG